MLKKNTASSRSLILERVSRKLLRRRRTTWAKLPNSGVSEIPTTIWESAEIKEELEDWLLSQNPKLICQLR